MALIAEVETLIKVGRHPNIVSLVGACTFEGLYAKHFTEFCRKNPADRVISNSEITSTLSKINCSSSMKENGQMHPNSDAILK